jgi:putative Holliday junction resolvase
MTQTILAIDYGLARVGFAYGAKEAGVVSEKGTWSNDEQLMTNIQELVDQENIDHIIVGLPRGLDGQETEQTQISREFAEALSGSVELRDEAGTSELAKERLGKNPPKEAVDAEAAAIMLEEFLHE